MNRLRQVLGVLLVLAGVARAEAPVSWDKPAANGDRIPDFSSCGYQQGNEPPVVPQVATLVAQASGDDGQRIQQSLDAIAGRPADRNGFRGALLLKAGEFRISGRLFLRASGVVLRGEGESTVLRATGATPRSLIVVGGGGWRMEDSGRPVPSKRVAVGACEVPLADVSGLAAGQTVGLVRNGNAAWIQEIGMDRIPPRKDGGKVVNWSPFSLVMDRRIVEVRERSVVLDAPVVSALEERWGGGSLRLAKDTRIENAGVENLRAISDFDPAVVAKRGKLTYPSDARHAEYLVEFSQAKNAWARNLTTRNFAHGPVKISSGKWISVLDCGSEEPIAPIDGGCRYPFSNNGGQLCLFRDCVSDRGRHSFVYGSRVVGPNVFLRCRSTNNYASSEPHHRWSVGGLYDGCDTPLAIINRGNMGGGHGWSGAHYVVWNCRGEISCESPPTAWNVVFGHMGRKVPGPFRAADGTWVSFGKPVVPPSLYEAQRAAKRQAVVHER